MWAPARSGVDHAHVQSAVARRIVDGEHGPAARSCADAPATVNLSPAATRTSQRRQPQPVPPAGLILGVDNEARDVREEGPAGSEEPFVLDACPHRIVKKARHRRNQSHDRASLAGSLPRGILATLAGAVPAVAQPKLDIMERRGPLFEVQGVAPAAQGDRTAGQGGVDSSGAHDPRTPSPADPRAEGDAVAKDRVGIPGGVHRVHPVAEVVGGVRSTCSSRSCPVQVGPSAGRTKRASRHHSPPS